MRLSEPENRMLGRILQDAVDEADAIPAQRYYLRTMSSEAIAHLIAESKRRNRRTVLVVTALDLELKAVLAHVDEVVSVMGRDGAIYECGVFTEGGQEWLVVMIETGAGNHSAQSAVTNAHIDFSPELQIFVGVAGSRKEDVPIGSVVAADHVYSPYGGKFDDKGYSGRPREFSANPRLLNVARKVRRDGKWVDRILDLKDWKLPPFDAYPCDYPPLATVAPAVSTEAVSASKTSALEAHIAQHYGDANIVEMEGFGALFAADREGKPAIVIRGVSDMADKKDPATDKVRQPVAAAHAAAFAFELLSSWTLFDRPPHGHISQRIIDRCLAQSGVSIWAPIQSHTFRLSIPSGASCSYALTGHTPWRDDASMTEADPTPKQIKAAVSLFDVIDSITPLQKVGYDGRGVCPFHPDQTRGLHVDASKELYRCFSCGRQGDVIRWTMDHERVDEEQAMRILSRRAGL